MSLRPTLHYRCHPDWTPASAGELRDDVSGVIQPAEDRRHRADHPGLASRRSFSSSTRYEFSSSTRYEAAARMARPGAQAFPVMSPVMAPVPACYRARSSLFRAPVLSLL